jgi:hypothetical protein
MLDTLLFRRMPCCVLSSSTLLFSNCHSLKLFIFILHPREHYGGLVPVMYYCTQTHTFNVAKNVPIFNFILMAVLYM